jgi:heme iron utilization protein
MQPSPEFDATTVAKKLLREARSGALATLMRGWGDPYCSLVNVATAADGSPLLFISRLAVHTKNILTDWRVSLMLDERREGDPLEGARIMLMGTATATENSAARRRYLARHPEAKMFASFADFGMFEVTLKRAHLVAGFGRIVDLEPQHILTRTDDAQELVDKEPQILAHMNEDHADAVRLYATRLLGADEGAWQCIGCDPEGLEFQLGRRALRLAFPNRIRDPVALRQLLVDLAEKAKTVVPQEEGTAAATQH